MLRTFEIRNDLVNPRGAGQVGWFHEPLLGIGDTALDEVDDPDLGECIELTITGEPGGFGGTIALVTVAQGGAAPATAEPVAATWKDLIYVRVLAKLISSDSPDQRLFGKFSWYVGGPNFQDASENVIDHALVEGDVIEAEGWHPLPLLRLGPALSLAVGAAPTGETVVRLLPQIMVEPWGDVPAMCVGDLDDCAWEGTANESPSVGEIRTALPLWGLNDYQLQFEEMAVPIEDDVRLHGQLNASMVRFPITYSDKGHIPQTEEGGPIDWGPFGEIMDAFREAHLQVLPLYWQVPPWMNESVDDYSFGSMAPEAWPLFAELHADFHARWSDIIVAAEFGSEPNLGLLYGATAPAGAATSPDPAEYAGVLAALYDALKGAAPGIPVLAGSLSHIQTTNLAGVFRTMSLTDFLEGMLDAGAGDSCDAISVHPYPSGDTTGLTSNPDWGGGLWAILDEVRFALADHDLEKPIWCTECGYPRQGNLTASPGGPVISEGALFGNHRQAQIDALLRGALSRQPDVDGVILHTSWAGGTAQDALGDWNVVNYPTLTFRPAAGLLAT